MANGPPYKRKQYLVDRAYQLRFVTRLFLIILLVATASALVSSILVWRNTYTPGQTSQEVFIVALVAISSTLLIELLLAIPLIFVLGIRQSHRIVGPMNRIRQTLAAIGQGDFSRRITLRQGDALEELAVAINQMAERLQQRFPR